MLTRLVSCRFSPNSYGISFVLFQFRSNNLIIKLPIMQEQRPIDNMEEKRDFDPAKEKRTMDNNREKGGLNEGNPNTDKTPATKVEEASRELGESSEKRS